jgi:hypothetical protein
VEWRRGMSHIWTLSVQVVQESGFYLMTSQLRGGILGFWAPPLLSHYPIQRDPAYILSMIFGAVVQPGLRIQLQEKRFSGCLGDMEVLLMCGGMASIWLLVISLERY